MCTALALQAQNGENFFARTMDFSHDIDPGFYIIPREYLWYNIFTRKEYYDCYSFIGIGQEVDDILAFFDGVNEKGFAAAALYFEGYADYSENPDSQGKEPIASVDFLHYLLGRCTCVDDLYVHLKNVHVLGLPDPVTGKAAPLHWIATDKSGFCAVIEQTSNGLEILENPVGVMANSPDFRWHMTNLRNYMELSVKQSREALWADMRLTPFGQGGGTKLLPGSYTSPDRFVRTSFLKTHCFVPKDADDAVATCLNILGNVTIPEGVVITDRETCDYTKYTALINTKTCEYFYRTRDNVQLATIGLGDFNKDVAGPIFLGGLNKPLKYYSKLK